MRIALVTLCAGAVGFLLYVLVALIFEWEHWRPSGEKENRLTLVPSRTRRNVQVLAADVARDSTLSGSTAGIGLRA